MKSAIYAGSFDPWTFGHQFVLDSALRIFDCIHVVAAVNPSKQGFLSPDMRARLIANAIDPLTDWWSLNPPFHAGPSVIVSAHEGLTAEYAFDKGIVHLIRGLRSTSDFESEFNLYFSNSAINSDLQTWAIMCPPELLYCSSTYVKSVVGKESVKSVGTSFTSQAYLLKSIKVIGRLFDLLELCFANRLHNGSENLGRKDLNIALQSVFIKLLHKTKKLSKNVEESTTEILDKFLKNKAKYIRKGLENNEYLEEISYTFLAMVVLCLRSEGILSENKGSAIKEFSKLNVTLGKSDVSLFSEDLLYDAFQALVK